MRAPLHLGSSLFGGNMARGNDLAGETPLVVLSTVVIAEPGAPAAAVAAATIVPAAAEADVRRNRFAGRYRRLSGPDLVETLDELRAIWPEGSDRPAGVADAVAVLNAELLDRYRARTA